MMWLLLPLSGIESNPGPTKYPCVECNKPVCYGRCIACDNCNKWYHKSCIEMHTIFYDCYMENSKLECECCNCAIKNISFSLFNHPIDSDHLLLSPICSSSSNITTKKAKQLQIMIINFQSVWEKKEELELALVENNIDVVIGCKTHLDPCILDSKFLPLNYTSFRRDIPGLGDHQSPILADIECHPKKQKPISRKIYLWKKANHYYVKLSNKMRNRLLQLII